MNILWIIKYSIYFHKLLSLNKFDRIRCLFCTNFKDEDSDLKKNSKVHDMKTKRRPIWMKIGSFWPLNLRRWINFLKVCVYYSISWYTYVDILFTHHHYPESWESIPYINLLHGNYTHKHVQHTVLVWTFCQLKPYSLSVYELFQFTAARWCFFMMPSLELWTHTRRAIQFWHQNLFVSKVSHCITHTYSLFLYHVSFYGWTWLSW